MKLPAFFSSPLIALAMAIAVPPPFALADAPNDMARTDIFVDVAEFIPGVLLDIRYFTSNNFVGETIAGYRQPKCLLTRRAAKALRTVQESVAEEGLTLKIFDCYRPQQAVDHFVRWAQDLDDNRMKDTFYPNINKDELFAKGYIAAQSGHSRGSTVDLTLVDAVTGQAVDMGTDYDFFDPLSHTDSPTVNEQVRSNRQRLKVVMEEHGFANLPEEWWHYTLVDEPHPYRYFNFEVE
ncbi:MAG: M15 family metallopeptidase [Porticoccaceae bacterium]|nr:M15 family metallopeptidase [Porticoccaceae bacterium]